MKLFDLHCDTFYECCETEKTLRDGGLAVSRADALRYTHYVQVFALFCGARAPNAHAARGRRSLLDTPRQQRFDRMLRTAQREFAANQDWLTLCCTAQQLLSAQAMGKHAAVLAIEGAELLPEQPDALQLAWQAGVRVLTISWNHPSRFCTPALLGQQQGLTPQGRALVRDCSALGIILDVSHLSDRGFWELCELHEGAFLASHSNARAVCAHARNLTDEQCIELARRDGLIGVNFYTPFVTKQQDCTLYDVLDHVEYLLTLCGEEHIALGCDLDGCDKLPLGIGTLADLEQLAELMLREGYAESTVQALFYDNAFAFFQRML